MRTSRNTSINSNHVPKGLKLLKPEGNVLDYGSGKYWNINKDYCMKMGAENYVPYDPYQEGLDIDLTMLYDTFNTIYCTNVLNVIEKANEISRIIMEIGKLLTVGGKAIFTMYEGDKTGKGRETKPDCWQRNQTTNTYRWYFYTTLTQPKYWITSNKTYILIEKLY